jgi:Dolichyl-phosphate-mannose-protein mannosyltransferase
VTTLQNHIRRHPHRPGNGWSDLVLLRGPRAAILASCGTFTLVVLVATSNSYPLSVRLAPGGGALLPFRWASRVVGLNALPHNVAGGVAVLALGLAGTGFLFAIREAWYGRISLRTVLTLGVAFHAVVVLLPLLISQDVYQYAIYGRIAGVHHANPYLSPPRLFPADTFSALASPDWRNQPAPYGPGFIMLARLVSGLANRPQTFVFIFKLLAGLASVATMLVVADIVRRRWPSRAAFAAAVIALNPAVLFAAVGSGHNDAPIALLIALAFGLRVRAIQGGRSALNVAATAILTLAAMIKPPLLLLVVAAVTLYLLERPAAERARLALTHAAVVIAVALPLAFPFLSMSSPFGGLAENYVHASFSSPWLFTASAFKHLHLSDVHLIALILRWGSRAALLAVFVAATTMVLRLAHRQRSWQSEGAAYGWILLLYIVTSPQVWPWYFLWILPVAWLLPTLPRTAVLGCCAVLPIFVSVSPEFFPDLYNSLVYVEISLVASALLVLIWLLVKDLVRRTKNDASLWEDQVAPDTLPRELLGTR